MSLREVIPGVVLGRLTDSTLRVIRFPGCGQADGGIAVEVPLERVDPSARMPNTALEVVVDRRTREIVAARPRTRQNT
jgi:hypothetical protein